MSRAVLPLIALALFVFAIAIPQSDLAMWLYIAAWLCAGFGLFRYLTAHKTAASEPPEDDKHVVLFKPRSLAGDDCTQCPHCGETVGLGIKTCPRCGRSLDPKSQPDKLHNS